MMLAVKCKPQATAVELAQLGEVDDSPQCGEMSRRDKRARHPLKMEGKLALLNKGIDERNSKSKKSR